MIVKMTKYSFILLSSQTEDFLKKLQEIGVVDISRSVKPVDDATEALVRRIEALQKHISRIENDDMTRDAEYVRLSAELSAAEKEYSLRLPWGRFDAETLKRLGEGGVKLHFYCVPESKFKPEWADLQPLEVISTEDGQVRFVTASFCENYSFPVAETDAPAGCWEECAARIRELKAEMDICLERLRGEKRQLPALRKECAACGEELQRALARAAAQSAAEKTLDTFVGFAPTSDEPDVCKALDDEGIFYIAEPATAADNPPVKLKNNWFARNFETLTGMYGMPVYDEFDPTPILAPFFVLFWAFCMGDAGYGLILIAIGFLLEKMDILGLRKHKRLVITLGVGATLIGFFLGTFFGVNLTEVSWMPDSLKKCMLVGKLNLGGSAYDLSMVAALAIGVVHICLAMVVKAIGLTRRCGFKEAISTWGWIILIIGGLCVAALALTSVLDAAATKIAVTVIGVLSALGIFIFNKPGRNPLLNIGAGLWDTYGMVTGIFGDVLSYIRLYALGLAGGMLGAAFNSLGEMVLGTDPTWQWLPFVVILLIGHALNFAMSCLGAFVHPLRLTFVEYFKNSGYEGKGAAYNPLKKQ